MHSFLAGEFNFGADASFSDVAYSTRVKPWKYWINRNIRRINKHMAPRDVVIGSLVNPIFDSAPPDAFLIVPAIHAAVPEPATALLLTGGSLGLRRRRAV